VVERDDVRILGETVDHREHHQFAVDTWESLDEIYRDVGPDYQWDL
jgi:hypothetical protein